MLLDALTASSEPSPEPARKSRDRIPVSLHLLLTHLLRLPEARMDAMLRKAARFDTGKPSREPLAFVWEAAQLKWTRPSSTALELSWGDTVMRADLSWRDTTDALGRGDFLQGRGFHGGALGVRA